MRLVTLIIVAALAASPSFAQTAPKGDPIVDLDQDLAALVLFQRHVIEDFQKVTVEMKALRAENERLKAQPVTKP